VLAVVVPWVGAAEAAPDGDADGDADGAADGALAVSVPVVPEESELVRAGWAALE
jgi:hypothetical protein